MTDIGLRTRWGAIWGGMFTFASIWAVFEALGYAIFNSANAAPGQGVSLGMEIWTVILTIIAMYVGGLETGRLAGVIDRHDGLVHGMIMFGLSTVSAAILLVVASGIVVAGAAVRGGGNVLGVVAGTEWAWFIGLVLGWLAAMGGASTGAVRRIAAERRPPVEMRPAA